MTKTSIIILIFLFSCSCSSYFRVKTEPEWKEDHINLLKESGKKIVVHFRDEMKLLTNPVFGKEEIRGTLETYYSLPDKYTNPNIEKNENFPYQPKYKKKLFSEVHVFVNENYSGQSEYLINRSNFFLTNMYSHNTGLTIFSYILPLAAVGGLIYLFISQFDIEVNTMNCPQTYVETTPGQYQFIGGLFTGAIRQDLQRNDMIPLPATMSDTIRIRIKGMQDETQYIDHAEVRQVVHPEGTVLVGDRQGELFIIRHLKMPNEVKAGNMIDRSKTLLFRDGQNYQFNFTDSTDLSPIQLKFTRKDGDKKALLVARMKNSSWGGYINNQLRKTASHPLAFQTGYESAIANSAMRVSLLTRKGWKAVDFFPPAGNTAERDLAMQIDLSDVEGNDVMIKMESPYRFWDVDQVGLTYEISKPVFVSGLCRISASVSKNDFSASVDREDGVYLALQANDQLELEYTKPTLKSQRGTTTTYLLTAGGYYRLNLSTNISQMSGLQNIDLNQYSIAKYKELGYEYRTFFRQQ